MPWLVWASLAALAAVLGLAVLDGYLRGREMAASVEGEENLHG